MLMPTAENKLIIQRFFNDVFNQRQLAVLDEIIAPIYVNHARAPLTQDQPRPAGTPTGIAGQRRTVEWLLSTFPDLAFTIDSIVAEGDQVVAYVTMSGTHQGTFQGIAPTGKLIRWRQAHRFHLENAKITDHWAIRDDLELMQQLDVISITQGQ